MIKLSESTRYVLEALIPYTEANMKLTYKPNRFFNELEHKSNRNSKTLKSAYYRAVKKGLIMLDANGVPRLTDKGVKSAKLYNPKKLGKDSILMVIFDIPEEKRQKRDHLRSVLYEMKFEMLQQSVWFTRYDYREYLAAEMSEYGLSSYVQVYEAVRIKC